ncbi:MAG: translation initiation factor IF-2 [Thermoguttaceae bacterium]
MSIRIYALAKQLKVESKTLLDICKKLGLEGKGNALASLTEEEAEQIKTNFQEETPTQKPAPAPEPVSSTPVRPVVPVQTGKVPVLKSALAPGKPTKTSAEEDSALEHLDVRVGEELSDSSTTGELDEQESSEPVGTVEESEEGTVSETASESREEASVSQDVDQPEPQRDSTSSPVSGYGFQRPPIMRGPIRTIDGKVPTLASKRKSGESGSKDVSGKSAESSKQETTRMESPKGTQVRLAPLPKQAAKPVKVSNEPAPQKPDLKLPKEAIRAAAQGTSRPLDEHIRKHEEKRLQAVQDKDKKGAKVLPKKKGEKAAGVFGEDDVPKKGERDKKGKTRDAEPTAGADARTKWKSKGVGRGFREDVDGEESGYIPRQLRRQRRGSQANSTAAPRKSDIVVQLPCTVKQFAERTGLSVAVLIRKLMEFGTPMMINSMLDKETADLLGVEFGLKIVVRDEVSLEEQVITDSFDLPDDPASLQPRPPVVTFLGHVDHGKTSLLDRILNLNVVSGEKGGITQHIRAYRIPTAYGGDVTFVDTPGHEAFTEMRARGANCTDIAVLVVAADDGVMPQTEEAISHIKAAGVPIVVAMNKMDLPGANPDRAIQGLAQNDLMPSEWGGDVEIVRCSAITGMGVDDLMRTLLMVAELHELKANPDRPAIGVVLESELHPGQGVVCKTLVQNGTLRAGDVVLCGTAYGRVKAMYDTFDSKRLIEEATPSTPVHLIGLDVAPTAGSKFCVLNDISLAREIAEGRLEEARKLDLADSQTHITLENLFQRINQGNAVQTLNIIIRADVRGSIEAIRKELAKLEHPEVKIRILQATVGGITEADVQLADASDAIIVGFNVVPDENARSLADKRKIQVRRYDIIYNLSSDIKAALEGMLKPLEQVKELGRALVQRVYTISRVGTIAGCRVLSGSIERDSKMRIIRESRIIGEYHLDSLKREKDDAKEVREGYECGMKLKGFNDLKEGDLLEAYKIEEIARTF